MLKSAEYVLESVRPRVLWGENAPALYQGAEDLVQKLVTIGVSHGYTFSMVKTDSQLHGLPQRRVRTFYFFWRSPTVPMLRWTKRTAPKLVDYLALIPRSASLQDVFVHDGAASERFLPYQFVLQREGLTHRQFSAKSGRTTIAKYLEKYKLIDECIAWLRKYHPNDTFSLPVEGRPNRRRTHIDVLEHMKYKLSIGKGYWDDSLKFMGDCFTAVISKNINFAVHPTEDRFFSVRELLHLMGMPHDFELENPRRNLNHLCQNVPVATARDWAGEVIRFCRGQAEMTEYTFLRQDNTTQGITDSQPPQVKQERSYSRVKLEVVEGVKKERVQRTPYQRPNRWAGAAEEEPSLEGLLELSREVQQWEEAGRPTNDAMKMKNWPTRSSVQRIMEQHRISQQQQQHHSFADKLVKFNAEALDANSTFRCGLCHFETRNKMDLNKHWLTKCTLDRFESTSFQCSGCGAHCSTKLEIQDHWAYECRAYVKQEVKEESRTGELDCTFSTNLLSGTYKESHKWT